MGKSIADTVNGNWARLSGLPGGKKLFSLFLGRTAPYSGTIGAYVEELRPGYARVSMKDRKKVRNHLNCVHAIALMNLGEIATGLATISGMPSDARSILSGLSMEYLKKARGTLTAECSIPVLESSERKEYEIIGEIKDASGEVVARATATWLVGPRDAKKSAPATSTAA
ncbi:MAG: DUF4442 domain-containing protein [Deltaproteobacteria bacterium]|nr:DUF4442 domain-containing protein [Deltaproteobacteria bacterium]